jgi:hypothetical protein
MPESIVDKWRVFADKFGLVEDKPIHDTNLKKFLDDVARQQEPKKVARSGTTTGKVRTARCPSRRLPKPLAAADAALGVLAGAKAAAVRRRRRPRHPGRLWSQNCGQHEQESGPHVPDRALRLCVVA